MTIKLGENKKGGITLVALIFTIVLSTLLAGVFGLANNEHRSAVRTLSRESAFHVAESGIEIAMLSFKTGALKQSDTDWTSVGVASFLYEKDNIDLGGQTGSLKVLAEWQEDNKYLVSSVGTVRNGGVSVERAVQSVLDVNVSSSTPTSGGGDYPYVLFTRNGMFFTGANGVTYQYHFKSFDSDDANWDDVNLEYTNIDFSFEAILATIAKMKDPDKGVEFILNNPVLWGKIISGGVDVEYGAYNHLDPTIIGEDTAEGTTVDTSLVVEDSEFEAQINDAVLPSDDPTKYYSFITIGNNDSNLIWNNGEYSKLSNYNSNAISLTDDGDIVLGTSNQKTYIEAWLMNPKKDIYVKGDVVIEMIGNGDSNFHSTIHLGDGDSLTIVGNSNALDFASDSLIDNPHPSQLKILSNAGGHIQIQSKVFSGVINAPYSRVDLNRSNNDATFYGAIVADFLKALNTWNIYYDVSLGRGAGSDDDNTNGASGSVDVKSWNEVPPSSVASKFTS